MKEVALMLVRAAATARAEQRKDDAYRIDAALAALLRVDDDEPESVRGTRMGIGPCA